MRASGRSPVNPQLRPIVKLAVPLAAAQAGQAVISLTDTAVMGRTSAEELAGVALGNSIFFTVFVLCMGAVIGIEPLVSQAIGAGDYPRARRAMRQSVWLAAFATVPGTLIVLGVLALLPHVGVDPTIIAPTRDYTLGRLPGLFPALAFISLRGFLQGHNVTRPAVLSTIAAIVINVFTDLLLVFGDSGLVEVGLPAVGLPALGAAGAGIASAVVSFVQAGVLVEPTRRLGREEGEGFSFTYWREALVRRHELFRMLRVGGPMGLQFAFEVAFFSSVSLLMGRMGALMLAAHQVALTIASAPFQVCMGIGSATSVVVGQRIGASDQRGALVAGTTGIGLGFAVMTTTGLLFVLFPSFIVRVFTDDPDVIAASTGLLRIAGFFALSDGTQAVASGALRGAGDTLAPFFIHLCAHWGVGMPCALVFAVVLDGGAEGLWWGLTTGLTVSALSLTVRFVRKARRGYVALEGSGGGAPA